MQEVQAWSLGQEDPLEEGKAAHSSILAWRILRVHRVAKSWTRLRQLSAHQCRFLFQATFLTRGSNPRLLCLLHWQADSWPSGPPGKPLLMVILIVSDLITHFTAQKSFDYKKTMSRFALLYSQHFSSKWRAKGTNHSTLSGRCLQL